MTISAMFEQLSFLFLFLFFLAVFEQLFIESCLNDNVNCV